MKLTICSLVLTTLFFSSNLLFAQSKLNDINPNETPKAVFDVLGRYTAILRQSESLDQCAERFAAVAGGSLVNEDGETLRGTVKPYALKKDFQNIQFYQSPVKVTRVNKQENRSSGFGPSAIRGTMYKIWIAKKDGASGMPAPISIMVPEGHPSIKEPKVVGIGSL
ncbi:MAG: hypothetical protein ACOCZ8_00485 [Bacteroidota bacterium]